MSDALEKLTTRVGSKGNVRIITISDNVPDHWDELINITKLHYQFWAYIFHDKDETEKHLHIVAIDKGGTTLKKHCERFSSVIPSNMVCKGISSRSLCRYLVHKDCPEKYQYTMDEVFTNSKAKFESYFIDENDSLSIYDDYKRVKTREISPRDFIEKHKAQIYNLDLAKQLQIINYLERII